MLERIETRRKFRNHRHDHNELSWRQAAITVEKSVVNDKANSLRQTCVEAEEAQTRNQSSKVFSIIRDLTKSITNSATNMNKSNGDPPVNKDELVEE